MKVDVMGPPPGEESDSKGECECATLHASSRGGPCYYCAKEGHFLRNCTRKAAGLPRSAPFIDDRVTDENSGETSLVRNTDQGGTSG